MKKLIFSLSFFCIQMVVHAQNYDIRFNRTSVNCQSRQVCYDVQLRPNGSTTFNLGGQNYRIYYDASKASYISGSSVLPSQYGSFTLNQDIQNVNADATNGPLTFEATLSFLNYSIDLNDTQNGGIVLPANQWTSTSNLCFTVTNDVINNASTCLEAIWGRDGLTNTYGTAFVEVSRWVTSNNTTNSSGILYDDLNSGDGDAACFNIACAPPSGITVSDVSVNENAGQATVQICIATATSQNVTVNVSTANSSAATGLDYTGFSNILATITAGQTCTTVNVPILDDNIYEGNETFNVNISNPSSNATISDGTAVVTIVDNEAIPSLSINSTSVNENVGSTSLTVSLSSPAASPVTFNINTSNGTAVSGADFTGITNQSFTIPAGQTSVNIPISILDDTTLEGNENFNLVISGQSSNSTIAQATGTVTILDNEQACAAQAPVISGN